jgi:hypothetical protein
MTRSGVATFSELSHCKIYNVFVAFTNSLRVCSTFEEYLKFDILITYYFFYSVAVFLLNKEGVDEDSTGYRGYGVLRE